MSRSCTAWNALLATVLNSTSLHVLSLEKIENVFVQSHS